MRYTKEIMSNEFTKHIIALNEGENLPFNAVIHHFTAADKGGPHDHPWSFTTHILKGGYIEKVYYPKKDYSGYNTELIHRKPGTVHTISAEHIHELIELPEGECWTLVIPKQATRDSRFWRFDETGIYSRAWYEQEFKKH